MHNFRPLQPPGGIPINPNDPSLKGGVQLNRVPVIAWERMVAIGIQVYRDGKVQLAIFDPQTMEDPEEVFQVLRLLLSIQQQSIRTAMQKLGMAPQGPAPGPVAWDTVPECVQRHFRFKADESAIQPG